MSFLIVLHTVVRINVINISAIVNPQHFLEKSRNFVKQTNNKRFSLILVNTIPPVDWKFNFRVVKFRKEAR